MKKKVINKGYTLTVTSWENDGDNYKTKSKTVETSEEALKINKICKELFVSCNNGEGGIGNSMENEEKETLLNYIDNNPFMTLTEDYINNLAYELMGGSEYYDYRVFESCVITYSPEDVYVEEVIFN
jgi:hypothetical protein